MKRAITFATVIFSIAGCAGSDAEYDLRLGHDQTRGHPYDLGVQRFADNVSEATGGAVIIRIYPSSQLGDSPEQVEGLHLGTLDLALSAFSHASQFCTELGIFSAPYLFEDEAHFAAVFDGEIGNILDEACRDRYSIGLLSTFSSGNRLLVNGRRPLESAADLQGLTIRVMGGEADALTWQAFGAIPVPMPYSEVYSALQAGVIDGAENEAVSVLSNRFYEAAPYFALTDHLVQAMGLFVSERTMDRLPEEYREIMHEQAREAAMWQRDYVAERNAAALIEMQERFGVQVSGLASSDLRASGTEIQDYLAGRLGQENLLQMVRAAAD